VSVYHGLLTFLTRLLLALLCLSCTACSAAVSQDVDFRGGDLIMETNGQTAASVAACCGRCATTPQCAHYTFDAAASQACWLKAVAGWEPLPYTGAISGSLPGGRSTEAQGCSLQIAQVCDTATGITYQNECIARKAGVLSASIRQGCCAAGGPDFGQGQALSYSVSLDNQALSHFWSCRISHLLLLLRFQPFRSTLLLKPLLPCRWVCAVCHHQSRR
jgi:hypothetical protein